MEEGHCGEKSTLRGKGVVCWKFQMHGADGIILFGLAQGGSPTQVNSCTT